MQCKHSDHTKTGLHMRHARAWCCAVTCLTASIPRCFAKFTALPLAGAEASSPFQTWLPAVIWQASHGSVCGRNAFTGARLRRLRDALTALRRLRSRRRVRGALRRLIRRRRGRRARRHGRVRLRVGRVAVRAHGGRSGARWAGRPLQQVPVGHVGADVVGQLAARSAGCAVRAGWSAWLACARIGGASPAGGAMYRGGRLAARRAFATHWRCSAVGRRAWGGRARAGCAGAGRQAQRGQRAAVRAHQQQAICAHTCACKLGFYNADSLRLCTQAKALEGQVTTPHNSKGRAMSFGMTDENQELTSRRTRLPGGACKWRPAWVPARASDRVYICLRDRSHAPHLAPSAGCEWRARARPPAARRRGTRCRWRPRCRSRAVVEQHAAVAAGRRLRHRTGTVGRGFMG